MKKISMLIVILLCTFLGVLFAAADEIPRHEFPHQNLKIQNFIANGYILDIGGGGEGVIGQMKPKQVVAIDLYREELEDSPVGPLKIVMDATDLKFLDSSFSTATSFFTLMYMDEETQEKSFRELSRVLTHRGRFLIWDVNIPGLNVDEDRLAIFPFTFVLPGNRVVKTGYGASWPKNTHDLAYFKTLAKNTGFKVVREKSWAQSFFLELENTKKGSLAEELKMAAGLGVKSIRTTYQRIKAESADEYEVDPYAINKVGQRLKDAGQYEEAIAVFKINVLEFPNFWGWHDSLADAYLKSGNKKLAIEEYEKALQLDPSNKDVQDSLKRLKSNWGQKGK